MGWDRFCNHTSSGRRNTTDGRYVERGGPDVGGSVIDVLNDPTIRFRGEFNLLRIVQIMDIVVL